MAAQERDDDRDATTSGDTAPADRAGAQEPGGPARHNVAPDGSPDETARVEPVGPAPGPGAPPPVGPSGTSVLPPTPGGPPEPPRWAARAQVPTPRVEQYGDEWVTEPPRSLLVPVLVTVC